MADVVRYRVDEAIRWIDAGADAMRREAAEVGREAKNSVGTDPDSVIRTIKKAASSARSYGKGAVADVALRRADAVEYVLGEEGFDVVKGRAIQTIRYDAIRTIEMKGDRALLVLESGTATIKPVAHLVTPGARVPIGWNRNGLDAPYATLLDEIAARAGISLTRV